MSHNCLQDCIDFQCCCSVLGSDRSFLWWHIIPVLSFCIPVKLTLVLYFIGRLCRKQYVILYESGWNGEVVSRKSCMCVYSTATLQYVSPNPRPCQLPSSDWNSLINSSHLYAHKTYSFFLSFFPPGLLGSCISSLLFPCNGSSSCSHRLSSSYPVYMSFFCPLQRDCQFIFSSVYTSRIPCAVCSSSHSSSRSRTEPVIPAFHGFQPLLTSDSATHWPQWPPTRCSSLQTFLWAYSVLCGTTWSEGVLLWFRHSFTVCASSH